MIIEKYCLNVVPCKCIKPCWTSFFPLSLLKPAEGELVKFLISLILAFKIDTWSCCVIEETPFLVLLLFCSNMKLHIQCMNKIEKNKHNKLGVDPLGP